MVMGVVVGYLCAISVKGNMSGSTLPQCRGIRGVVGYPTPGGWKW